MDDVERLRKATREIEGYIHAVGHDLRAPLRAMHTLAEYTLRDQGPKLDEEGRANLTSIRDSAARASALVEDLLKRSKEALERGRARDD